ncbi:hypothetical protein [Caloranaerobacter sp. DY30410]
MDKKDNRNKFDVGRFSFLSVGWWVVHILLLIFVFFLLTRIL